MAYEQKPNAGALFQNVKKSPAHPDLRGDLFLDKTFLVDQMDRSKGNLVKISIAAWNNTSKTGKPYTALTASQPYEKAADEDVPY